MESNLDIDELVAGRVLTKQADIRGEAPAILYDDRVLTYADLEEESNSIAKGLMECGVSKGTHVAIMMKNCPEYLSVVYALAKIGAVGVPIGTWAFGAMLEYFILDSDSTVVITGEEYLGTLREIPGIDATIQTWIIAGTETQFDRGNFELLHDLRGVATTQHVQADVKPSDPFLIQYTSGTTGPPKGILSPHSQSQFVAKTVVERFSLTQDDRVYTCLPLFHGNALVYCSFSAIRAGASVALARRFSASRFWGDISKYRATVVSAIMSMATILEKLPPTEEERANSLRLAFIVPTPINRRAFEERFGLQIVTNYGMTETTQATFLGQGEAYEKEGTAGSIMEEVDLIIADEDDMELSPGTPGEILVRPKRPGIFFSEYYGKPAETVAAWRNLWMHTGDRAYVDEDGYLFFVDRIKEAIRRRGENISAYDVERLLLLHTAVIEVAAVPVPSEVGEDDVGVYVVRQGDVSEEELVRFAEEHMPYFMVPRYVRFVDELPKTPTQKIAKYILKEQAKVDADFWDREAHGISVESPEKKAARQART